MLPGSAPPLSALHALSLPCAWHTPHMLHPAHPEHPAPPYFLSLTIERTAINTTAATTASTAMLGKNCASQSVNFIFYCPLLSAALAFFSALWAYGFLKSMYSMSAATQNAAIMPIRFPLPIDIMPNWYIISATQYANIH